MRKFWVAVVLVWLLIFMGVDSSDSQTHTFAALDVNNIFTGIDSFTQLTSFNGGITGTGNIGSLTVLPTSLPAATSSAFGAIELNTDLAGTATAPTVVSLHFGSGAFPLSSTPPTTNQILSWNGTNIIGIANGFAGTGSCQANQFVTSVNSGNPTCLQPSFTNLSGNISTSQMNNGSSASSSTFWRGDGTWQTVYSNGGSTTSVCSTTSSAGATCQTTVNLSRTEADTNYKVGATCVSPTQFPFIIGVSKSTGSVTVTLTNGQGNQAQVSTCAELDVTVTR